MEIGLALLELLRQYWIHHRVERFLSLRSIRREANAIESLWWRLEEDKLSSTNVVQRETQMRCKNKATYVNIQ